MEWSRCWRANLMLHEVLDQLPDDERGVHDRQRNEQHALVRAPGQAGSIDFSDMRERVLAKGK